VTTAAGRCAVRVAAGIALAILCLAPRPAGADDTLSVVLGTGLPPLMDTLDLVAQGAGLYHDEHLTVTKMLVGGGADALNACANDTADICPMSIESLFTGYEHGIRAQLFLTWASRYTYVLAVLDESPIRTLAGFKGATIGVHTIGTIPLSGEVAVDSMLGTAGLTPADFSLLAIGFNDQALQALRSGRVAAAAFPFYELIPFQVAGTKLRIFENPILADTPSGGYAASPATIAAKGDALRRFARAIVKAALLVRLNPAGSARLMLQAHGEPFTDGDVQRYTRELTLWEDSLPARDPANPAIGAIPLAGEDAYSKLLAQYGVTKAPVPVSAVATNAFNAFANDFDHAAVAALAQRLP
jgi:ABC-type nitrate/sulfonate/bicarbonate transport system substrate-binding protein